MSLLIVVNSVLLVLAVSLLVLGRRGRRVDDHPVCRRCGFDLFGLPAGSRRCSECGADLTLRRAVLAGSRGRRWLPLAGGAVLLLLSGPPLAVVGMSFLRPVDVTGYKSAAGLIKELDSNDPATRMAALDELTRRVRDGGLSDRQLSGLVDRALAHQADRRARSWSPKWGELVEAAQDANRLDGLRWSQYLSEAVTFELGLRPRVRRGDPMPFYVTRKDVRVGRPNRFQLIYSGPSPLAASGVPLGSDPRTTAPPTRNGDEIAMEHLPGGVIRPDPEALAGLADGWHTTTADLNVTITDLTNATAPYTYRARATWGFALLPADQPSVTVRPEPALADVVRPALKATVLFDGTQVTVWIKKVADPTITLAPTVSVRAAGREWPIGSIVVHEGAPEANDLTGGLPAAAAAPGFTARSVDVVLRSSAAGAVETMHLTNIWEGEVVLENVPVVDIRVRAATQPAPPGRSGAAR